MLTGAGLFAATPLVVGLNLVAAEAHPNSLANYWLHMQASGDGGVGWRACMRSRVWHAAACEGAAHHFPRALTVVKSASSSPGRPPIPLDKTSATSCPRLALP